MGVEAVVGDDGKLSNISQLETGKKTKGSSKLDKNAFLQLLVAQMQYQDPWQPTDNTEYIAQLATFSQLEATTNMATSMEQSAAYNLVGKTVKINATDSVTGKTTEVTGTVDYVQKSGSKVKLCVNGVLYDYDDVAESYSDEYAAFKSFESAWNATYALLPAKSSVNASNAEGLKDNLQTLWTSYSALTDTQKSTLDKDKIANLKAIIEEVANYGVKIDGYTYPTKSDSTTDSSSSTDSNSSTDSSTADTSKPTDSSGSGTVTA